MFVLGLDVGTQGARALVCDGSGIILAQASEAFPDPSAIELLPPGYAEQHPSDWWDAACACLRSITQDLRWAGLSPDAIRAVAVDSTSGTVVPMDKQGLALRPALMYNDSRAEREAEECQSAGEEISSKLGYRFSSSFALPKILWIKRNEPQVYADTVCFAHAADYIVSRMTGNCRLSDTSNALKTGYDLVDRRWPDFVETDLGISLEKLPQVTTPGLEIGVVTEACASETGLSPGTPVVAGVTDGTAGFLASGAVRVGDWNSTIGTTLVVRGVARELIRDPQGRIYCHSHPQGYWLPGGASNVGAECLAKLFHGKSLDELNAYVPQYAPTYLIVYPLVRQGERFPFVDPDAEGFIIGQPRDSRELYTAYLEGVGYVERWCLELLGELGADIGDTVFTTGGGASSAEWMEIRAAILNKRVVRPKCAECAMGAATVAASHTLFDDLESAVAAMVKPGGSSNPDPRKVDVYDDRYAEFREACSVRGYV